MSEGPPGRKKGLGLGLSVDKFIVPLPSLPSDGTETSPKKPRERMKGEVLKGKNEAVPQVNPPPEPARESVPAVSSEEHAPASPSETAESVANPTPEVSSPQERSSVSAERGEPVIESPDDSDEVLQKFLDATAHKKPTLRQFKDILNNVNADKDRDISYDQLEKIGITAAKRLEGKDYNAFKKYITGMYDLNDPDNVKETPGLDFLRDPAVRPVSEQPTAEAGQKPEVVGAQKSSEAAAIPKPISPEIPERPVSISEEPTDRLGTVANKIMKEEPVSPEALAEFSKELKESEDILNTREETEPAREGSVPEHLPGSSPDEYEAFEKNLRGSVADWREKKGKKEGGAAPSLRAAQEEAVSILFEDKVGPEVMKDGTSEERRAYFKDFVAKAVEKLRNMGKRSSPDKSEEQPGLHSEEHSGEPHETKEPRVEGGREARQEDDEVIKIKEQLDSAKKQVQEALKEQPETSERGARWKKYLSEAGAVFQDVAKEYGTPVAKGLNTALEMYNGLDWKTRTAITAALMLGTGPLVGASPAVVTGLTYALYGQRIVGGAGLAINVAKALKKPESIAASLSNLKKNWYSVSLGVLYTAGNMYLVSKGLNWLQTVDSDQLSAWAGSGTEMATDLAGKGTEMATDAKGATMDWLSKMLGFNTAEPGGPSGPDVPSSGGNSPPVPPTGGPEVSGTPNTFDFEGLTQPQREALMSEPGSTLGPDVTAMPESHPEPYNLTDPRFDIEIAEGRAEMDKGIAGAKEAIDNMQKLTGEQSKILNSMPDGTSHVSKEAPFGRDPILGRPLTEQGAQKFEELTRSIANAQESATRNNLGGLNEQWDKLYEQREQIRSDLHTAETEGSTGAASELRSAEAHVSEQMSDTKQSYEAVGANTPFGRDPIDGHPMTEQEAKALEQLRNNMHEESAREAAGMPPREPEGKGFFERLFGSSDNAQEAAGQFSIDSVSATTPHIYADTEGNFSVYGGSPEQKVDLITAFLGEHPDATVFGSDDNGVHRVLWSRGENPLPVPQMVHKEGFSSFFSLLTGGSSFAEAPKPEEFVKIIK